MRRRTLFTDTRGLSTVEYVILLVAVACLGIAGWRMLGRSSWAHTEHASGEMSSLDAPAGGPGGPGGQGGHVGAHGQGSHVDDATGDASPPPDYTEGLFGPGFLLLAGLLLVVAIVVRRMQQGAGAKGGSGTAAGKKR